MGIQTALAMGLPLSLFTLLGHQPLGLIASLGGFTALYCASMRRRDRVRILPLIAVGLALASALGVLCSSSVWLSIFCLIAVAALACTFTIGMGLGPPGPLMFVIVSAVSTRIASSGFLNETHFGPFFIPALVLVGAIAAYLIVIAPLALPSVRDREKLAAPPPPLRFNKGAVLIILRVTVGTAIASLAGLALGVAHSYWVVIPAIAVLQVGLNRQQTTTRTFQRVLGTFLGVFAFGLLALSEPRGVWLVAVIMLLQFAVEVVVTKNYGLALVFITPLALTIATVSQAGDSFIPVRERVLDTLLGSAVALMVYWGSEWFRSRQPHQDAV
ncbi:FUSC family protein [Pontibacter sp. 13R65]|uniref:FUSC family protein n=2 Tax=Pontibacter sp. 13R65 TaxID=3127458 RepID=UPI0039C98421